jgi:hypothetical protein
VFGKESGPRQSNQSSSSATASDFENSVARDLIHTEDTGVAIAYSSIGEHYQSLRAGVSSKVRTTKLAHTHARITEDDHIIVQVCMLARSY